MAAGFDSQFHGRPTMENGDSQISDSKSALAPGTVYRFCDEAHFRVLAPSAVYRFCDGAHFRALAPVAVYRFCDGAHFRALAPVAVYRFCEEAFFRALAPSAVYRFCDEPHIYPDDISRFQELGVTVSMQPDHFGCPSAGYRSNRGGTEKNVFLINTLMKKGPNVAFGTDFPIDVLNPLLQIYRAVTRTDSSGQDVWHPHERITLSEALKAYTSGSAYGTFREDELGTLEAGKLADIVVIKQYLFDIPAGDIPNTDVELTIADGNIVYEASKAPVKQ